MRVVSASSRARSAATVDRRSSQKVTGPSHSFSKLRAKARVDWHRGPSEPSMLRGRPSTIPPTERWAMISCRRAASNPNFLRRMVSSGLATDQNVSETATPMVLSPRSSPINDRIGGRAAKNSPVSSKIIPNLPVLPHRSMCPAPWGRRQRWRARPPEPRGRRPGGPAQTAP